MIRIVINIVICFIVSITLPSIIIAYKPYYFYYYRLLLLLLLLFNYSSIYTITAPLLIANPNPNPNQLTFLP